MASRILGNTLFADLLMFQLFVAGIARFPVVRPNRSTIAAVVLLQAVWRCWIGGDPWMSWLQFAGILLGVATLFKQVGLFKKSSNSDIPFDRSSPAPQARDAAQHGPWLLPCKTSHTRKVPKKHSFAYSYLQIAFQVGASGVYGDSFVGIERDIDNDGRRPWFTVSASDFLFRGASADGSLKSKLDTYLKTEQVDIEEVPYVFLVTAPRFLGYSFNPVSFWYLYDKEENLRYMILEVNNTFDERRMYFLDRQTEGEASNGDSETTQKKAIFRHKWTKDFHVSPFNSRKGSYSLMAWDPGFMAKSVSSSNLGPQVDNTITLTSSKTQPKLVARLFSTGPAVHASSTTALQQTRFILAWFWVGFFTFPRILIEAAKLFFSRGLHVWFRPEVMSSSIGRQASWREKTVGEHFGRFLHQQCRHPPLDAAEEEPSQGKIFTVPVLYTHPLAIPGPRTWILGAADGPATSIEASRAAAAMQLQVLSPGFYAQYVLDENAVRESFLHDAKPEARLVSIRGAHGPVPEGVMFTSRTDDASAVELINTVLSGFKTAATAITRKSVPIHWQLLPLLRGGSWHPMDWAVYENGKTVGDEDTRVKAEEYRRAVLGLLFSKRLAFGVPELLDAAVRLYELALVWQGVRVLAQAFLYRKWDWSAVAVALFM